jgi:hypothetical protein
MSAVSLTTCYLPHINNYFTLLGIHTFFGAAVKGPLARLVAKGLLNQYHRLNPKCERVKLAFSLAMTGAVSNTLRDKPAWWRMLVRCAMRLGVWFLLRKGEYLRTSRNGGGLPRSCLTFSSADGSVIPYHLVGILPASSLGLKVVFSKVDRYGYGRLVTHQRQPDGSPCIVTEMERFIALSRGRWHVGVDQGVFVWPDGTDFLADEMADEMKRIAVVLGCDADRVSAHSLRYGGASLLASFGLPQYLIEYFGGWAKDSKTLPLYARPEASALAVVSHCFGAYKMGGVIGARLQQLGL